MNPLDRQLAIITPVHESHVSFLPDAWQSIANQVLPPGWSLRWHVREDGPPSNCEAFLETLADARIDYSASFNRGGVAEARNMALTRVDAEFVCVLDADDMLVDGSLARTIEILSAGNGWVGSSALDGPDDLQPRFTGYSARLDSQRRMPPDALPFVPAAWHGPTAPGRIRECWEVHAVIPFHPATWATRTEHLWEVGGWPGLARDEDTACILAVSDRHGGWVLTEPAIIYRHHESQTSQLSNPMDERIEFIRRRQRR